MKQLLTLSLVSAGLLLSGCSNNEVVALKSKVEEQASQIQKLEERLVEHETFKTQTTDILTQYQAQIKKLEDRLRPQQNTAKITTKKNLKNRVRSKR